MNNSRYQEAFERLKDNTEEAYELIGDCLLVEQLKEPERKIGSFIMVDAQGKQKGSLSQDRPHFVQVLAVGKGYYDDDTKEDVPLNVKPGDIVLVGPLSVKYFSFFGDMQKYEPDSIGITREAEVQMRFRGKEGYAKAFEILNQSLKDKVEADRPDAEADDGRISG